MISIGDDCVVAGKIAALQSLEVVHGGPRGLDKYTFRRSIRLRAI